MSTRAAVVASANAKDIAESVRKCKNFLSTLMRLACNYNQPEKVVQNVTNLIQGLIDGNVEPEDFTNQLQKELKSSPQPYLVPFLKKSLPFLCDALIRNRMTIDGIRPPIASVATAGLSLATMAVVTPAVPVFSIASCAANLSAEQLSTSTGAALVASANVEDIEENVRMCKNFLSTLMKVASKQPKKVVQSVKNLIKGLIDGTVEPEDFTNQLQEELTLPPQPYLVPFLRESLPFLRDALFRSSKTIDGVLPLPASVATVELSLATTATVAHSVPVFSVTSSASNLQPRSVIPNSLAAHSAQSKPLVPPTTLTPQQQQLQLSMLQQEQHQQHLTGLQMVEPQQMLTADQAKNLIGTTQPVVIGTDVVATSATITNNGLLLQMNASIPAAQHKGEKRKYEAMRDDDDICDVTAMDGVNLMEESCNSFASRQKLDKS